MFECRAKSASAIVEESKPPSVVQKIRRRAWMSMIFYRGKALGEFSKDCKNGVGCGMRNAADWPALAGGSAVHKSHKPDMLN
jgi:hypothetical protein